MAAEGRPQALLQTELTATTQIHAVVLPTAQARTWQACSPEQSGGRQVATVAGVSCTHHVLGIPHLLRQLGHAEGTVLLAAA